MDVRPGSDERSGARELPLAAGGAISPVADVQWGVEAPPPVGSCVRVGAAGQKRLGHSGMALRGERDSRVVWIRKTLVQIIMRGAPARIHKAAIGAGAQRQDRSEGGLTCHVHRCNGENPTCDRRMSGRECDILLFLAPFRGDADGKARVICQRAAELTSTSHPQHQSLDDGSSRGVIGRATHRASCVNVCAGLEKLLNNVGASNTRCSMQRRL